MSQSSSRKTSNPRAQAISAITAWQKQEHLADAILDRHRYSLSSADKALLQSLFYGWLRHRRLLRHWASSLWNKTPKPQVALLIELGLLQLLILELAEHAAVNESVSLAPPAQRGFVNALLREAQRQKPTLLAQQETLPLAVAHSHPDWLIQRWQKQFDRNQIADLLFWNNSPAPLTARLNPLHPQAPMNLETLGKPLPDWPEYVLLESLPQSALQAGKLYATDPSTSLAPRLLAAQPQEQILDACASPGGKSFQLAALCHEQYGELPFILATDPSPKRLSRLKENMTRLKLEAHRLEIALHDWTSRCPPAWRKRFDAVLLDLPCSNSGVLRRRVDARWRIQDHDFAKLQELQLQIAQKALEALKPNGRIIWSSCSIDREENKQGVAQFLQRNPQLKLIEEQQLSPWQDGVDGAYAAKLMLSSTS